jgi:hypothetical protein
MSCLNAVTCSDLSGYCRGEYTRKLCVTCSDDESKVRVRTNSFPNHCFKAILNNPQAQVIDFTVDFNPYVYRTVEVKVNEEDGDDYTIEVVVNEIEFESQTDIDSQLCNQDTYENAIASKNRFVNHGGSSAVNNRVVGVAITGAAIFKGTSEL